MQFPRHLTLRFVARPAMALQLPLITPAGPARPTPACSMLIRAGSRVARGHIPASESGPDPHAAVRQACPQGSRASRCVACMVTSMTTRSELNVEAKDLEPLRCCTLACRIAAPSSLIVVYTQPISTSLPQQPSTMAAMTSTMQLARSAVPARSVSRSCPAAAQSAMFGSRLAVRPAAVQVTRSNQFKASRPADGSDPRVIMAA